MKKLLLLTLVTVIYSVAFSQTYTQYFESGKFKFENKAYRDAIVDFDNAIEINPNIEEAHIYRGCALDALNEPFDAMAAYKKAIEINPKNSDSYSNVGSDYFDLENYYPAIQFFNKAIELNSKVAVYYTNRGVAKDALFDYRGAIQDYNQAILLNPKDHRAYLMRGVAKQLLVNYKEAILDYTKCIEINPKESKAYFNRGICKVYLKQKESGCLDLSKAGEMGNNEAYNSIKKYCQGSMQSDSELNNNKSTYYSQKEKPSSYTNQVVAIKSFLDKYSLQILKSGSRVSFKDYSKTLVINDNPLPLAQLDIFIETEDNKVYVHFKCKSEGNCLEGTRGIEEHSLMIPFVNKIKGMEFISLIEKLM
jgi:tetratricopeptide (TPR) repeat protein